MDLKKDDDYNREAKEQAALETEAVMEAAEAAEA